MSFTTFTQPAVVITCVECGVSFAITQVHDAFLRKTGLTHYCPNGHSMFYNTLKKKAEELKRDDKKALKEARREIVRLKSQLVDKRHEAEMAEARDAEKTS